MRSERKGIRTFGASVFMWKDGTRGSRADGMARTSFIALLQYMTRRGGAGHASDLASESSGTPADWRPKIQSGPTVTILLKEAGPTLPNALVEVCP